MATATQNVQNSVNRAVSDAKAGDYQALKKDVEVAAKQASQEINKQFNKQFGRVRTAARDNPVAAAGVCFGIGAFIGAAIFAIARPMPTPYDQVRRALRDGARRTRRSVLAGWRSARRAM